MTWAHPSTLGSPNTLSAAPVFPGFLLLHGWHVPPPPEQHRTGRLWGDRKARPGVAHGSQSQPCKSSSRTSVCCSFVPSSRPRARAAEENPGLYRTPAGPKERFPDQKNQSPSRVQGILCFGLVHGPAQPGCHPVTSKAPPLWLVFAGLNSSQTGTGRTK